MTKARKQSFSSGNKQVKFQLKPDFIENYANKLPDFGFNGLGELVYYRTYSRKLPDGRKEAWYQTVERVVNGTFNMQKDWILQSNLDWSEKRAQKTAMLMYDRIFHMKFLPPGRGLWAMGTRLIEDRKMFASLNNCAFVSTGDMVDDPSAPFCFLMDASMLGVGVGFDTKGAGKVTVRGPLRTPSEATIAAIPAPSSLFIARQANQDKNIPVVEKVYTTRSAVDQDVFVVPDSRQGWVQALKLTLDAYLKHQPLYAFDFSLVRPAGSIIKAFGGVSQGPAPLIEMLESIQQTLKGLVGCKLTVTAIVDIMNFIGRCVVAGNIRRTAEIAFGDPDSAEYIDLKNYEVNPHRGSYGWVSNNSVFAKLGMDYHAVSARVRLNGEPGFAWLENMQSYGRMGREPDHKDRRASGGNPCLEQTLESYEMCCLVETFPDNHESLEDFLTTLECAFLYAKTVTLGSTHWSRTNQVMTRNRRIGTSMSGLVQFVAHHGLDELKRWCETGYQHLKLQDARLSEWLGVPRSVKITSVKPSGTVSLLAGATPGVHFPESRFYIRRVRLDRRSELVPSLLACGYKIEEAATDKTAVVVEIPVDVGDGVRTLGQVSMWEQLALAAFMQRYWADNQVSVTVTFDPKTEGAMLPFALDYYQYQLKGVTFLPRLDCGAFEQMPYESIAKEAYEKMVIKIKPFSLQIADLDSSSSSADDVEECPEKFCDGDKCEMRALNGSAKKRAKLMQA